MNMDIILSKKDCNGPTPKPVTRTRNSFGPSVVEWVGTAGMDGDDGGTRKSAVKLQRLRQEQEFTSSHAQTTRPTPDNITIRATLHSYRRAHPKDRHRSSQSPIASERLHPRSYLIHHLPPSRTLHRVD